MSRLSTALEGVVRSGKKAMGLFLTNGFPALDATVPLLHAMESGGADFIELGMPFSDPLAEGLPIQHSSARALAGGARMEDAFVAVQQFREHSELPVVLMGYINPVLQYGVSNFCAIARSSGVDGLIIPDLPPDEAAIIIDHARANNLETVFLVAPNTFPERVRVIDRLSSGFVYAVSVTGITGTALDDRLDAVAQYLGRLRTMVTKNPLLVGFGIKTREDAHRLCQHADGFIVGSALVGLIDSLWSNEALSTEQRLEQVTSFVQDLRGPLA